MMKLIWDNVQQYRKQPDCSQWHIIDSGLTCAAQGWRHKCRFLENYELLYVAQGHLHLRVGGRLVDVAEQQVIVLPAHQTLDGARPSAGRVAFYWVDFLAARLPSLPLLKPRAADEAPALRDWLQALCQTRQAPAAGRGVQEALLFLVLDSLGRPTSPGARVVERVATYVDEHLAEPLTAQKVAAALHYHPAYVSRVLRSQLGLTLKGYVVARRMEAARILLRTAAYPVVQIATQLGFEDGNAFSKFFTYHQQMTPTQYRQSMDQPT